MNISVFGLWHLGCVTAACLAADHSVTGIDDDSSLIESLKQGRAPVSEKGLDELIQSHNAKTLRFTTDLSSCAGADLIWITFDTPVDENDNADVEFVVEKMRRVIGFARSGAVVAVSSQLPVGTVRRMMKEASDAKKNLHFACIPENLRLGAAIECFVRADRYVVGTDSDSAREVLTQVLSPYTANVIYVSPESAEMSKHALNCFLALSVVYANEIAAICERTGADASEVERCLKADVRIGKGAYLSPGPAFSGGTLARDASFLGRISKEKGLGLKVVPSILAANEEHKFWPVRALKPLRDSGAARVCVLGLTYKPGTDTLRRSLPLEICARLREDGWRVCAYDPAVKHLPDSHAFIDLKQSAAEAMRDADALILLTAWPEFKEMTLQSIPPEKSPAIVDPAGVWKGWFSGGNARYFSIGRSRGAS